MAERPSRRSLRDRGPYITLKWHRRSRVGAALIGIRRVPWGPMTCVPLVALVSLQHCAKRTLRECGEKLVTHCIKLFLHAEVVYLELCFHSEFQ